MRGDFCFVACRENEKASPRIHPAGWIGRVGPSGVRSDGDERALGRILPLLDSKAFEAYHYR